MTGDKTFQNNISFTSFSKIDELRIIFGFKSAFLKFLLRTSYLKLLDAVALATKEDGKLSHADKQQHGYP